MEATNLLPLDEEHDSVNISARSLNVWVHCCPAAQGVAVRRGLLDERKLTSVHVGSIQVELVKTVHRQRRLAPDNPFLSDDQRNRLDGDGVIVAGRRVNVGDVLVSVVEVDKTMRPRRAGLQWIRDASERVPPGWDDAHVLSATRLGRRHLGRSAGRTIDERIKIAIRAEHPLSTGDILLVRQHVLGIVSRMVPDDEMPKESDRIADLAVSSEAAAELGLGKGMHILDVGKAGDLGVFNVHAHADGLYSLITQQPLGGRLHPTLGTPDVPCPASVTTAHVRWLRERGLNHLLAELVSLKSDDRHHRSVVDRLRDTDAPAEDYPVPGTPQSLYILRAELISLGLHVECIGNGQVTLRLRPATREELLSYSNGAIEKPDTIAYQNLKEVPGGILCPNVFGNDYRFGHFELPVPIVPYLWRIGSPSPLTRMLGIDAEQIEALLYYHSYVRRSDGDLPWRLADNALPDDPSHWLTGAEAVRALLADVAAEAIPAALRGRVDAIIQNVVLLPPAFMRPVILLDSGNFATSDLNDLYAQLINRAKRLAKLMQLNAPAVIVREECRMLQQCADGLWANCVLPEEIAVHDETSSRRLVDLLDLATKRIINAGRKRVTRSGRARAVAESSVPDGEVLIPRQIFDSLRLSPEQPVVMTSPEGNAFIAACPKRCDGHVLRLSPTWFERMEFPDPRQPICELHVPLGAEALDEARRLMLEIPAAGEPVGADPLVDA
ncbi:MAG: hypothetical protein HUU20_25335, partial [Pirellulales bacterium]|nr:hypothetical protein [Pirellulales bacterium]